MRNAYTRPDFKGVSPKQQGMTLANEFLTAHGLPLGPVPQIEKLTELVDADLLILDLPDGVDALTLRDPDTHNIVIGVATSAVPYRQNFTMAHEIGHIVAGDLAIGGNLKFCMPSGPAEDRANSFAAHVLCPLQAMKDRLHGHDAESLEALSLVVQEFKISPSVAAAQMSRAGLISSERRSEFSRWSAPKLSSRFGWRDAYEDDVARSSRPHPAPRLVADATQAYLEGTVSAGAVALARGISVDQVHEEFDSFVSSPETTQKAAPANDPFDALTDFFGTDE